MLQELQELLLGLGISLVRGSCPAVFNSCPWEKLCFGEKLCSYTQTWPQQLLYRKKKKPAQQFMEADFPFFSHTVIGFYTPQQGEGCTAPAVLTKHGTNKSQLQEIIFSFYLPMTMTM